MFDSVPKRKRLSTGREDPGSRAELGDTCEREWTAGGPINGETAFENKRLNSWEGHFGRTKFRVILKISLHVLYAFAWMVGYVCPCARVVPLDARPRVYAV